MKKILYLSVLTLVFVSCERTTTPGKMTYEQQKDFQSDQIRYFKDHKTQKCFAERGVNESYSFTCIPCDSLVLNAIKNQ